MEGGYGRGYKEDVEGGIHMGGGAYGPHARDLVQRGHGRGVALLGGQVHRRAPILVGHVEVGAGLQIAGNT